MGMALISSSLGAEDEKEENKHSATGEKQSTSEAIIIHYITDFSFGFFFFPFFALLVYTTINMVRDPELITDATAILYIALITGVYYLLSKRAIVKFETKPKNILLILAGFVVFMLFYLFS